MNVKLTDRQVGALTEIQRAIQELQARADAMVGFALAGADVEPAPWQLEKREDGVYIVDAEPQGVVAD